MRWVHLTSTLYSPYESLCHPGHVRWLWRHIHGSFRVLASAIMPSHPHVIVADEPSLTRRFGALLGAFGRFRLECRCHWAPVKPVSYTTRSHVRRGYRYVVLNPCRAGLAADPLAYPWTSHRDTTGAIAEPSVDSNDVAEALGERLDDDFAARLHAFVSADPSVSVEGTPPPRLADPTDVAKVPLGEIARAAASATRGRPADVAISGATRRLFVHLAWTNGWRDAALLARVAATTPQTISRLARSGVDHHWDEAGRRCLADPRLRTTDVTIARGAHQR